MEAVAALSLACNVLQLVEQSYCAVRFAKGLKDEHAPEGGLAGHSALLHKLGYELQQSVDSQDQSGLSECDQDLREQAKAMLKIASKLSKELNKFTGNKWKDAAIYIWKKPKIEGLEKALSQIQQDMDTKVLLDLRKRLIQDREQVEFNFRDLREQLQDFILKQLKASNTEPSTQFAYQLIQIRDDIETHFKRMEDVIADESAETRAVVVRLAAQEQRRLEDSGQNVRQFVESLWFQEMNARFTSTTLDHFDGTFEWIFESSITPSSEMRSWRARQRQLKVSSFLEWLRNNQKLFWISGKPGSGKSTLMRFLIENLKTRENLKITHPNILVIRAFLWRPGTPLQKSCRGVLCSLLHQILSHYPSAAEELLSRLAGATLKKSPSDWSLDDLKLSLQSTLERIDVLTCIFIDGLDEAEEEESGLPSILDVVEFLQPLPRVKLCVSSRPEPLFEGKLQSFPHLRLHDLTWDDIEKFVRGRLYEVALANGHKAKHLVDLIVWKAEGVFLWARLVVWRVLDGISKFEDWELLEKRIDTLPNDLTKMYEAMWERLGEDEAEYRKHAALYFRFMLHSRIRDLSVAMMTLVARPDIRRELLKNLRAIPREKFDELCLQMKKQIPVRSAGLLEIDSTDGGDWRNARVSFIHRSASDFLAGEGRGILADADARLTKKDIFESRLLLHFMFGYMIYPASYQFRYPRDNPMSMVYDLQRLKSRMPVADQITCINTARTVLEQLPEWRDSKRDCLGLFACCGFTEAVECGFESEIKQRLADRGYTDLLLSSYLRFPSRDWEEASLAISWLLDNKPNPDSGESGTSHNNTAYPTPWIGYLLWLLSSSQNVERFDNDSVDDWYKTQERILLKFVNRGINMDPESICALIAAQSMSGNPFFGYCTEEILASLTTKDRFSLLVGVSAGALVRVVFSNWESRKRANLENCLGKSIDSLIGTASVDLKVIGIFGHDHSGIGFKEAQAVIQLDQHWSKREGLPDSVNLRSLGECFSQDRLEELWEENKNNAMDLDSAAQWLVDGGHLQLEVMELHPGAIFTPRPT